MPKSRKTKSRRAPFLITVAKVASAAVLLPACGSVVATSNPPPVANDPACPSSTPAELTACSGDLVCTYGEPGCQITMACEGGGSWKLVGEDQCTEPPPPGCPDAEPGQSTPCTPEGTVCTYTVDYGCGPETNTATCGGGLWQVQYGGGTCNPPPPDFCTWFTTEAECGNDPSCRWLTPGCDMPALPAAGCFPITDCTGDFDCPTSGGSCQQVSIDPCYLKACAACSQLVSVCVPPPAP